jgi:hypothetical protein
MPWFTCSGWKRSRGDGSSPALACGLNRTSNRCLGRWEGIRCLSGACQRDTRMAWHTVRKVTAARSSIKMSEAARVGRGLVTCCLFPKGQVWELICSEQAGEPWSDVFPRPGTALLRKGTEVTGWWLKDVSPGLLRLSLELSQVLHDKCNENWQTKTELPMKGTVTHLPREAISHCREQGSLNSGEEHLYWCVPRRNRPCVAMTTH